MLYVGSKKRPMAFWSVKLIADVGNAEALGFEMHVHDIDGGAGYRERCRRFLER
jgi:hypothetical protein